MNETRGHDKHAGRSSKHSTIGTRIIRTGTPKAHSARAQQTPMNSGNGHTTKPARKNDRNPPAVMLHGERVLVQFGRRVLTGARA